MTMKESGIRIRSSNNNAINTQFVSNFLFIIRRIIYLEVYKHPFPFRMS